MGSVKGKRGFSRLLELVLVLIILFALITTVTQIVPPLLASKENLQVLDRYATDLKNMICNSEKDREAILLNKSLDEIEYSIDYVSPPELNHRLVILNVTDGSVIQVVGDSLPSGASIITSSCVLAREDTKIKAEVQVWY